MFSSLRIPLPVLFGWLNDKTFWKTQIQVISCVKSSWLPCLSPCPFLDYGTLSTFTTCTIPQSYSKLFQSLPLTHSLGCDLLENTDCVFPTLYVTVPGCFTTSNLNINETQFQVWKTTGRFVGEAETTTKHNHLEFSTVIRVFSSDWPTNCLASNPLLSWGWATTLPDCPVKHYDERRQTAFAIKVSSKKLVS